MLVVPSPGVDGEGIGGDLAVGCVECEEFDSGHPFGCGALVGVEMRRGRADHGFPAFRHRLEAHDVRAGSVEHRVRLSLLAEVALEDLLEVRGIGVVPVGVLVSSVRALDGCEHVGVDGRAVVARESTQFRVVAAGGVGHDERLTVGQDALHRNSHPRIGRQHGGAVTNS